MMLKPTASQAPGSNSSNTSKRVGMQQSIAYLYDHLGNTRVSYSPQSWDIVNNTVLYKVESATDYTPYGKIIHEFVNELPRYLTTQHERDKETGLDYRGARYYDSDVARFLSLDPMARKYPTLSAYNYVAGNPIMLIDPDGREIRDSEGNDISTKKHEKETKWSENHTQLNETFGDPNGFNSVIGNKSNQTNNSTNGRKDGETNKSPNDGSSPNFKDPARIYFKNVPQSVLDGIRVIPEHPKSATDLNDAKNGKWYETDGLWIKGQKNWFKIPGINTVVVTYDYDSQEIKFNIETNIWGEVIYGALGQQTSPAFVPDSGKTLHTTDYPFK